MLDDNFRESKPTSAAGGIIGALIGAVIGAIPWAVAMYLGWFIGYLAFLIAFASFFGYKLLNGPRSKTMAMVTVFSFSILLILAMNFIMIAFFLYSEGYAVDMENIMLYIEIAGMDFIWNVVISLAIGVAGIVGIRKQIDTYINPQIDDGNPEQSNVE